MTTEDDFQQALVAEPRDWQTRLVFADWLEEHGDPRAAGYRAMGLRRVAPAHWWGGHVWVWLNAHHASKYKDEGDKLRPAVLPDDWYDLLPPTTHARTCAEERKVLREALDDAALAFAKLPPKRRAALLAVEEG